MSQYGNASPTADNRIKQQSVVGYTGHKPQQQFDDKEPNPYRILNEENRKHLPGYKGYIPKVKCENVLGQGFSRVASHSIEGRVKQGPSGTAVEDPAERYNTIQRQSFKSKDVLRAEQKDLNPFLESFHYGRSNVHDSPNKMTNGQPLQGGSIRSRSLAMAGASQMASNSSLGSPMRQSQLAPYHEVFSKTSGSAIKKPTDAQKYKLSERCAAMVNKAFKMMDKDHSGELTAGDIEGFYDVTSNPEFISGHKSKRAILKSFLMRFEGTKGNHDGTVTRDEWFGYYAGVRDLLSSDEYFVKMMESAWQVPENENTPETKTVINMLFKNVKARVMSDLARQTPDLLPKVFKDQDKNNNGMITLDEWTNLIYKLKISVERRYVYPFFKMIDKDESGGIEYKEFTDYILGDK